ncbi:serine/threonine-protein kinase fray2-like [Mercenaria mercenaria]|uniref:serine/threonine-protein kinase fray2-like n=1 Tax=Mercenaria mercenaria TaxID=6596 RepID=UPI00234EEABA|nr:serine/threonine-protein kinase fray2-like [Mercenaria mercenaria]XP_053377611.1 serine/threonine-protein kinase fray2-like [Mercenaria mercenaria]
MCLIVLILICLSSSVIADEFNADMENTGVCTRSLPVIVRKQDIYNIYAEPRQDGMGTRDRCTIRFKGDEGRRFKLCIRDLKFGECQVFIKMYDGIPEADVLNNARYTFGCNAGTGNVYNSYTSDISVSLEKPDSGSTAYKFYLRLTTEDGPDVCGGIVPQSETESPMSAGVIAGIVVAAILVLVVIVAVAVYLIFAYKRKLEEKEALAHSMLLRSSGAVHGGSSVHSSAHSSVHSSVHSSKHSMYPAFRTTISEKHGTCNSIETQSYDSEQVDSAQNGSAKLKPAMKSVKHEFDSMRHGLQRENLRKAREEEEYRQEEARRQEHQRADRQGRVDSNRGLGRSNRTHKADNLLLTDANIKHSLRQARDKGRSFDDRSSHKGSTRSSRTRNNYHSPSRSVDNYRYRADSDYNYSDNYDNDRNRDRGRSRSRSVGSRPTQRSSSTGSQSRRKRDYYDDRDDYSDYDDKRRRRRHDSRERYSEDEYRSRRDSSSHRSGTQRSRTNSTGRRNR